METTEVVGVPSDNEDKVRKFLTCAILVISDEINNKISDWKKKRKDKHF